MMSPRLEVLVGHGVQQYNSDLLHENTGLDRRRCDRHHRRGDPRGRAAADRDHRRTPHQRRRHRPPRRRQPGDPLPPARWSRGDPAGGVPPGDRARPRHHRGRHRRGACSRHAGLRARRLRRQLLRRDDQDAAREPHPHPAARGRPRGDAGQPHLRRGRHAAGLLGVLRRPDPAAAGTPRPGAARRRHRRRGGHPGPARAVAAADAGRSPVAAHPPADEGVRREGDRADGAAAADLAAQSSGFSCTQTGESFAESSSWRSAAGSASICSISSAE